MTRFWWVRHGPTHATGMLGWTDLPADLSDAAALARLDAALPRDAVLVSSDLGRATATADALAGSRRRLQDDPDLREIHFGLWEMRGFAEVEAASPDHIRAFWNQPGAIAAPQGECWNDLCARVAQAMGRLTVACPDRDVIVVAHFGAIIAAIQLALQIPATAALGHRIDTLSVTRIDLGPDTSAVRLINHRP